MNSSPVGSQIRAGVRGSLRRVCCDGVILGADATPGQVERLLADGARAYLTKPLDIGEFLALVDDVLAPDAPGGEG